MGPMLEIIPPYEWPAADNASVRVPEGIEGMRERRQQRLEDAKSRYLARREARHAALAVELEMLRLEYSGSGWLQAHEQYLAAAVEFYRSYTGDPEDVNRRNLEGHVHMLEDCRRLLRQAREEEERQRQRRAICKGIWFSTTMRCPDCNRFMEMRFLNGQPFGFSCRCKAAAAEAWNAYVDAMLAEEVRAGRISAVHKSPLIQ